MRSLRSALLLFVSGLLVLGCQANDQQATGPSAPLLGAAAGGCDNEDILAIGDAIIPNNQGSLKTALNKLCGDAEKLAEQGNTAGAGVKVGQAFVLIDNNFGTWNGTAQQVVDYIQAFCSLVPGSPYCPLIDATTLASWEAVCTTALTSTLITDNGRFAVYVEWNHQNAPTTCAFVAAVPHPPDHLYGGDNCTALFANSTHTCEEQGGSETGFWPPGAAILYPAGQTRVQLCALSGTEDLFAWLPSADVVVETVAAPSIPGFLCPTSELMPIGGLPGLAWRVTSPLRDFFGASPAYGGPLASFAPSGTTYQGVLPDPRVCTCSGIVRGRFDEGARGVNVTMTLELPDVLQDPQGALPVYPEVGTIVGTSDSDASGNFTVSGVCPYEFENDYTLDFFKTQGNQSYRANDVMCEDLSAAAPTKNIGTVTLQPGAGN